MPYVPDVTPEFARVSAPVDDIVASPDIDTNVGIDDEFITNICPPTPVLVVTGPVPAPISTPFEVSVVEPVPPYGTVKVPVTSDGRSIEDPSLVVFASYPCTVTPMSPEASIDSLPMYSVVEDEPFDASSINVPSPSTPT